MKLLLLSIAGKVDEPEDTRYINIFFASLKKYVVPYFDTKVILHSTFAADSAENSLLWKRAKEFGLEDVVVIKHLHEMELPEKSLNYLKTVGWFNRIGLNMNMLFDYAKKYDYFGADWIFHTDTDIEFLENFKVCMESIEKLKEAHNRIVISLAGDSYPYYIINNGYEYKFEDAPRANFYEGDGVEKAQVFLSVKKTKLAERDHRNKFTKPIFTVIQMKTRNDFVGISREAAEVANFNWIATHFPYDFQDKGDIQEFWPTQAIKTNENGKVEIVDMPDIRLNFHMGYMVQYRLHSNEIDIARVQLPGYTKMAKHYSSGWFNGTFLQRSKESLESKFPEYKDVWDKDYQE